MSPSQTVTFTLNISILISDVSELVEVVKKAEECVEEMAGEGLRLKMFSVEHYQLVC